MKLHILSDLHLEVSTFDPPQTDADTVVLAGDIWKGARGLHWARATFPDREIVYVPGNHEYYGAQRLEAAARMRIAARESGIHLLDEDEVVIGGVRFLGATLWTDFLLFGEEDRLWAMRSGQNYLSDFRVIHEGSQGHFSPSHSVALHEKSVAWLAAKLDEPFDGRTVVVTHHLPSMRSVAERFADSELSACFASRLDHLFGNSRLWIHGHTHDSFDYEAEGTRVICNPRGHEMYNQPENGDFDAGLVVEI